jgi:hypothetical protein
MARAVARLGRFEVRVVRTPWGRIECCESGRGEAVLLIHGVVGGWDGASTWRTFVPPGHRSITPARFGYLGSRAPARGRTHQARHRPEVGSLARRRDHAGDGQAPGRLVRRQRRRGRRAGRRLRLAGRRRADARALPRPGPGARLQARRAAAHEPAPAPPLGRVGRARRGCIADRGRRSARARLANITATIYAHLVDDADLDLAVAAFGRPPATDTRKSPRKDRAPRPEPARAAGSRRGERPPCKRQVPGSNPGSGFYETFASPARFRPCRCLRERRPGAPDGPSGTPALRPRLRPDSARPGPGRPDAGPSPGRRQPQRGERRLRPTSRLRALPLVFGPLEPASCCACGHSLPRAVATAGIHWEAGAG